MKAHLDTKSVAFYPLKELLKEDLPYYFSSTPYFFRNDTLFRSFDVRRGNLLEMVINAKVDSFITASGRKRVELLAVKPFCCNRLIYSYRLTIKNKFDSYFLLDYLEGIGWFKIEFFRNHNLEKKSKIWELNKINGQKLKHFLNTTGKDFHLFPR